MDLRQRIHMTYSAFAAGNIGIVEEAFDDEVDFVSRAPTDLLPYLGRRKGKAAVKASLIALHEEFEVLKFEPLSVVTSNDAASLVVLLRFRHRDSGRELNTMIGHFLHFRDGRIAEFQAFGDSLDMAEQLLGRKVELQRS